MAKKFSIIIISVIILTGLIVLDSLTGKKQNEFNFPENMGKENQNREKIVRQPAAAGSFYPAEKNKLEETVNNFLTQAEKIETGSQIFALIAPHAGYDYSGSVAGLVYKQLKNLEFDTVVITANSHYEYFPGISVFPEGWFKTPLGEVEIDSEMAEGLMKENERIFFRESSYKSEHAIEVQIPFLQVVLKNNFKIVPILFGNSGENDWQILAAAIENLLKNTDKKILLIASSDLSHYPDYDDANYADKKTIKAILSGNVAIFEKTIAELESENIVNASTFACSPDAVKTLLAIAENSGKGIEVKMLKYANSGDVEIGDKSQVVGYGAIGFFKKLDLQTGASPVENELDGKEQTELLQIARQSVETFVKTGKVPKITTKSQNLNKKLGAFVTIKKYGRLRGCIGQFSPTEKPLFQVVSDMAIEAAVRDPRFYPTEEQELPDLKYEISVLSEIKEISRWQDIELGKHGVEIKQGTKKGVFLPQVASEAGWTKEEFLSHLCQDKAGLPDDCYKDPATEIFVFTAQVFREE